MSESTKNYTGYVEKPKYIDGELIKAVDVVVDELIGKPYKQKIETIALSKYNDLLEKYNNLTNDYEDLRQQLTDAKAEILRLNARIVALEQEIDSEKILTAVANNETQAANDRYSSLLSDYQSAVTKGVQEAIARVSLEAQVAGLRAQKEVLKAQYDVIFQLQLSLQSQLTGAQASAGAAAQGFVAGQGGEFYYKLERNDGKNWSERSTWTTARNNPTDIQFAKLKIQNLKDTEGITITKVKLYLTGNLLSYGPFGFDDAKIPIKTKNINVAQGETKSFLLYAGNKIGGGGRSGTPEPDSKGWSNSAKDYSGTIQVEVTYSDGSLEKGDVLNWSIRKNKKG